jgi:FkbM family methyltransferase
MIGLPEKLLMTYARRFPIQRGKLRLVEAIWRSAIGVHGTQRLAHLQHGGLKMPCNIDELLQRQIYFFGTYYLERRLLDCWEYFARKSDMIFDVGANVGIYSLAALAASPRAVVHAFEPTPEIAGALQKTADFNNLTTLHVHAVAVLEKTGRATLRRFRGQSDGRGDNGGMNFVTTEITGSAAETVEAVSLDQLCSDHAILQIDLLKIDVQGHEATVLKGASDLLRNGKIKTIFLELNKTKGATGTPAVEAIDLLSAAGYWFAAPERPSQFRRAGPWLEIQSDAIAQKP